jgi:hypothetical protein
VHTVPFSAHTPDTPHTLLLQEWSTSLVSAENRALLLRTRPPRPFTSNSGDPDLLRSSSLPNFRSSNKPPSPRIQLEPLDLPPAESLDNGAGKTIFDRKSPRCAIQLQTIFLEYIDRRSCYLAGHSVLSLQTTCLMTLVRSRWISTFKGTNKKADSRQQM